MILEFKGTAAKVELYENKIIIKRNLLHPAGRGEKEIYLSSITAIDIKKPGLQSGYIQFVVAGSKEVKGRPFSLDMAGDENTLTFTGKSRYEEAVYLKNTIEELKSLPIESSVDLSLFQPMEQQISVADEIIKLKELFDMGILTEEEFTQQKIKLLNR